MNSLITDPDMDSVRRPVVHGQGMHGQKFTLLGAFEDLEHVSPAGRRGRIHAQCLLEGGHCGPETEQRFSEISFRFSSLEQWYWRRLFIRTLDQHGAALGSTVRRVEDDLSTSVRSRNLGATIEILVSEHSSEPSHGEVRVGHETRIRVAPDTAMDLEWFDEQRRRIQRLLILLIGEPVAVRDCSLRDTNGTRYAYAFADWLPVSARKERHMHRMPFAFMRVRDRFESLLDAWFALEAKCGEAIELLFSTLKEEDAASQPYEFLSRVQATEGILRPLMGGEYVSGAEFNRVRDALVSAIPADTDSSLRQALKDRLRFANEWSLRRRLKEGLTGLTKDIQSMILDTERIGDFVGSTVEGRNFWTHYDVNEKAVRLTITDASIAASRLLTFAVAVLLREMGVPEPEIFERLTATYSFLPIVEAYSFRGSPSEGS